ncbi:unnamed protein product [Cuscuta epithymum]|uniref:Uncharacterized protein n=1 Tax=Cuscuta epithymum TaxID=186058 RepID=A0AAV0EET0_9ASTE|nr:unnamed protein product [Cuscuta epithymum]
MVLYVSDVVSKRRRCLADRAVSVACPKPHCCRQSNREQSRPPPEQAKSVNTTSERSLLHVFPLLFLNQLFNGANISTYAFVTIMKEEAKDGRHFTREMDQVSFRLEVSIFLLFFILLCIFP